MAEMMEGKQMFLQGEERDAAPLNALESAKKPRDQNVGKAERIACILGGSLLAFLGLRRRSLGGISLAVMGGGLIARGVTGHCDLYENLKINTADPASETYGIHVDQAITIARPAEELFAFWRNFENLPRFMKHLQMVKVRDDIYSLWKAKGPAGRTIQWAAEIIAEKRNELISWKSLPGADIENAGSVRFVPAPGGRGTEMHVTLQYYPPGGMVGAGLAKLFGEEPSLQIADDLRRFKRLMETGEIATTEGQPSGKRSFSLPAALERRDFITEEHRERPQREYEFTKEHEENDSQRDADYHRLQASEERASRKGTRTQKEEAFEEYDGTKSKPDWEERM